MVGILGRSSRTSATSSSDSLPLRTGGAGSIGSTFCQVRPESTWNTFDRDTPKSAARRGYVHFRAFSVRSLRIMATSWYVSLDRGWSAPRAAGPWPDAPPGCSSVHAFLTMELTVN